MAYCGYALATTMYNSSRATKSHSKCVFDGGGGGGGGSGPIAAYFDVGTWKTIEITRVNHGLVLRESRRPRQDQDFASNYALIPPLLSNLTRKCRNANEGSLFRFSPRGPGSQGLRGYR